MDTKSVREVLLHKVLKTHARYVSSFSKTGVWTSEEGYEYFCDVTGTFMHQAEVTKRIDASYKRSIKKITGIFQPTK